ncbi:hypothetical protein UFOVP787_100 [uncultured Caudovirales phage]|uniref:SprT-like domain-containing protein n=1 Tax=uncultured Caudovirales phage TaxID=2100421 RepID=A0A6J5NTH6_9CAUD|nr:hypothetical protein UFOVP787_100 [uncultured Caudovirales phage]
MHIKTSGKPDKVPLKLCKEAVKFYGRKLLKEKLYHKISVTLYFEEFDKRDKNIAYCEWEYDNDRSKNFIIAVNKRLNKKQTLLSLAHEMVHLKQYATGELKDYLVKPNKSRWKGEIHNLDEIDYWDHPWEIEAHGREPGLYYRFVMMLKEQNLNAQRRKNSRM